MGYQKILVPLDGSTLSELAVEQAVKVANVGAHIHIMSVTSEGASSETAAFVSTVSSQVPVTAPWFPGKQPLDPHDENARAKYLDSIREWLEQAGYQVTVTPRTGDIITNIIETAHHGFEIIVMATHNRTGTVKSILGSVTNAVLSQSPCPVLVIPAPN